MKKNILKAAFVAAFAMIAGYGVYNSQKDVVLSDVALANIEALAGGEGASSHDCPGGRKECVRVIVGNTVHIFYEK